MVVLPACGLGVALAVHALTVFVAEGLFGPDWEERKVEELMRRRRGGLDSGEPPARMGAS